MGNLYFGTSKLAIVIALAMPLSACYGITMRSDQASFTRDTDTPDTAIYCGAVKSVWGGGGQRAPYPYTLHVSATMASGSPGKFRITFRDRDSFGFEVPAGTHTTSHALGGVPGVDDVVKITAEGGVQSMTARVEVWSIVSSFYSGAGDPFDPFDEMPAQSDNFCVKTGDAGSTSAEQYFSRP